MVPGPEVECHWAMCVDRHAPRNPYVVVCNYCSVKVAMDSDALIKLTKAALKEDVVGAMEVVIPPEVEKECVAQGKAGHHPDAIILSQNILAGRIHVTEPNPPPGLQRTLEDLNVQGGEAEVLRLQTTIDADLIVSDDAKFLRLIDGLGLTYATPAALVVALVFQGDLSRQDALRKLEDLAPLISAEEHAGAREALSEMKS